MPIAKYIRILIPVVAWTLASCASDQAVREIPGMNVPTERDPCLAACELVSRHAGGSYTRVGKTHLEPTSTEEVLRCARHVSQGCQYADKALYKHFALYYLAHNGKYDKEYLQQLTQTRELGFKRGAHFLGLEYEKGELVPRNYEVARQYFAEAAEAGDGWALAILGKKLLKEGDEKTAANYLFLALERGNCDSAKNLISHFTKIGGYQKAYYAALKGMTCESIIYAKSPGDQEFFKAQADALEKSLTQEQIKRVQAAIYKKESADSLPQELAKENPSVAILEKKSGAQVSARKSCDRSILSVSLTPKDLFRHVQGAVWMLVSTRGQNVTQGSAVAIDEHRLLTNCHVLQEAGAAQIVKGNTIIPVRAIERSAEADRCIVEATRPLPSFIRGVRIFSDVDVGESVYTVGAPRGLDVTFADGLVSSKRIYQGRRYIQHTAPISPGSSGGGLFDQYGNLIGINTFYVKESNSLNFAIAASDYCR